MSADLIFQRFLIAYGAFGAIYGCYYLPRHYIKITRKDKLKAASLYEKIWIWLSCFLTMIFIDGVAAFKAKNQEEVFLSYFLILCLPLAFGISRGLQRDSKLTLEERKKIKYEIDKLPDSGSDE